ncbi:MAG TPA: mechanosensitive ion channel family protein [Myxococcales bacterium]
MKRIAALILLAFAARADAPQAPSDALLDDLNQTIQWYRRIAGEAALATEPSDVLYLNDNLSIARQVLGLEFDFARADAALLTAADQNDAKGGDPQKPASQQSLATAAAAAATRQQQEEAQVARLQKEAQDAPTAKARKLAAEQLDAERSDLSLMQARAQTLKSLADFVSQSGSNAGLLGQIDELERSVPEARAQRTQANGQPQTATAATAAANIAKRSQPNGVVELTSDIFALTRKLREVDEAAALTASLRVRADKLRAPLLTQLRAMLAEADKLAAEPDSTDPAVLADHKKKLDQSTAAFKRQAAALVPLAKMGVLLDSARANLLEWKTAIGRQYEVELRSLLLRAGLLLAALLALLAASEFWRRATFRYVRDQRRRQQSLLVRRIVVTVLMTITVIFSLVSELGSLATFAGFITAGLAVALQNVILSVAAYFFLIGKYGVRAGDRVQIGAVTGDVLDIGLVRLHLMELGEGGLPTGRVVVFSNSTVFGSNNFFKQLPGSQFTWHQVKLTLASAADYRKAEERLMAAVNGVFETYRAQVDRQHAEVTSNLSIDLQEARPQSRIRLTEAGMEMIIRYPVPLAQASAIDDQISRALLDAVDAAPDLKLAGSGKPTIEAPEQR